MNRIDEDWDELGAILDAAREEAGRHLAGLRQRAVVAAPHELPTPALSEEGDGARAAMVRFVRDYAPFLSASPGPRYLGFVTGGATPAALAADWLVSAYDQNVSHDGGSIAGAAERHALSMLRELFGLPTAFEGVFVSCGTHANLVALATARQWAYERLGFDVAERGLAGAPRVPVLSGAPHASVAKALAVLGWGRASFEHLPCIPGRQVIDPSALDVRLRAHDGPAVIVANAGDVNTGDFDDIAALADIAKRHHAWLHVDGAIGLPVACVPSHAHLLDGVDRADSIAGDAHKWLNVPYDAGFVFTRHIDAQENALKVTASYLGHGRDLIHRTTEGSRRFRALPVLLSLLAYGRRGQRDICERSIACAHLLAERLPARYELLAPARLNVVCFAPRGSGDASVRDRILGALQRDGCAYLTATRLEGRPALRAAFSNWGTTAQDVTSILEALDRAAQDSAC